MFTEPQTLTMEQFMVGMAEMAVTHDQNLTLSTYPLGACLGVAIYDPIVKIGGLLHSLLPASSIDPVRAASRPAMFLDSGMRMLLEKALAFHSKPENLQIFVSGGAQILDETSSFNIGTRNFQVLSSLLAELQLKIFAEDIGGRANRTMHLDIATGEVRIKYSGQLKMRTLCKQ